MENIKCIAVGTDTRLGEASRNAIKTSFLTTYASIS